MFLLLPLACITWSQFTIDKSSITQSKAISILIEVSCLINSLKSSALARRPCRILFAFVGQRNTSHTSLVASTEKTVVKYVRLFKCEPIFTTKLFSFFHLMNMHVSEQWSLSHELNRNYSWRSWRDLSFCNNKFSAESSMIQWPSPFYQFSLHQWLAFSSSSPPFSVFNKLHMLLKVFRLR